MPSPPSATASLGAAVGTRQAAAAALVHLVETGSLAEVREVPGDAVPDASAP